MDPSACCSYSDKKRGLRRIQHLYWDLLRSRPPPVFCSWHPPCQVSALFLIVFVLIFVFPPDSLLCPHSPFCHSNHHHASLFFSPPPYFLLFSSCHCTHTHKHTHTLDIRINSLDFSAHNLTVNRKWLTWISILRYEHGARAAFVYTIMLLKAFTLTNCLRSKEEKKKREIQLSEMWEREGKRWIWSTDDSMYLSKHPHVLKKKKLSVSLLNSKHRLGTTVKAKRRLTG